MLFRWVFSLGQETRGVLQTLEKAVSAGQETRRRPFQTSMQHRVFFRGSVMMHGGEEDLPLQTFAKKHGTVSSRIGLFIFAFSGHGFSLVLLGVASVGCHIDIPSCGSGRAHNEFFARCGFRHVSACKGKVGLGVPQRHFRGPPKCFLRVVGCSFDIFFENGFGHSCASERSQFMTLCFLAFFFFF